jgi:thiamine-phosphate pyrophosphorylase
VNDFARHPLHAIVDVQVASKAGWAPLDLATSFLDGGARVLQLRAKDLPSGALLELADDLVALAGRYQSVVIVNDRVDVARMSEAHGVHVGQEDLPPAAAREQLGPQAIVGFSTHTVAQVEGALRQPVSYVAVGPVFGTATKETGYTAVGLDLVSTAARLCGPIPIIAIGGVTLENARSAIDAGASSVAVISDLLVGKPVERVKAFLRILE